MGDLESYLLSEGEGRQSKLSYNDLVALNTIALMVHQSLSLEEVYQTALDIVLRLVDIDLAMIYLVDEQTNEAVLQVHRGLSPDYIRRADRIKYPKGVTWKVINKGEIYIVEDVQKDPYLGPAGRTAGWHTLLSIPIKSPEKVIGVIHFCRVKEYPFIPREVELLSAIGHQVGTAIVKAKQAEELQAAKEYLEQRVAERTEELRRNYEKLQQTQAQLAQAQKLVAIGRMASRIAHEINNPVYGIQNCLHLIADEIPLDSPNRKYLNLIHKEITRIAGLANQLSNLSRPVEEPMEPLDINRVLEETLLLEVERLRQAGVEVERHFDPYLPPIKGSENQLKQVFYNLIINAQEAMPQGGHLRVRTARQDSKVKIEFTDTGRGIPREHLAYLFDPFFTTKPKGNGLGLSICYGIIHRHRGAIEVQSKPGRGATFTIILPIWTPPKIEAKTTKS